MEPFIYLAETGPKIRGVTSWGGMVTIWEFYWNHLTDGWISLGPLNWHDADELAKLALTEEELDLLVAMEGIKTQEMLGRSGVRP